MIYRCILEECRRQNTEVLAIGGIEDHLHVLAGVPSTISIADLVKQMKGVSSHYVQLSLSGSDQFFKWQGAYGATSVSPRDIPMIRNYVQNQAKHHRERTTEDEMEF
jgi:REP element-mobilizing transposase RayT